MLISVFNLFIFFSKKVFNLVLILFIFNFLRQFTVFPFNFIFIFLSKNFFFLYFFFYQSNSKHFLRISSLSGVHLANKDIGKVHFVLFFFFAAGTYLGSLVRGKTLTKGLKSSSKSFSKTPMSTLFILLN